MFLKVQVFVPGYLILAYLKVYKNKQTQLPSGVLHIMCVAVQSRLNPNVHFLPLWPSG